MEKHTLTKGNVSKGILLFVLPIIAGSLIQQLYVTIDAVVVDSSLESLVWQPLIPCIHCSSSP
ncbi:MAG: hypothetical protein ACLTI1_10425 [Clostridia bacterium]